jgi:hypothetical protein
MDPKSNQFKGAVFLNETCVYFNFRNILSKLLIHTDIIFNRLSNYNDLITFNFS